MDDSLQDVHLYLLLKLRLKFLKDLQTFNHSQRAFDYQDHDCAWHDVGSRREIPKCLLKTPRLTSSMLAFI